MPRESIDPRLTDLQLEFASAHPSVADKILNLDPSAPETQILLTLGVAMVRGEPTIPVQIESAQITPEVIEYLMEHSLHEPSRIN